MKPLLRIHLDPVGGIAGDMFVAAVAGAFEHLRAPLLECLARLSMPVQARARFAPHGDHSLVGLRFDVRQAGGHAPPKPHVHPHERGHGHGHSDHHDQEHEHAYSRDGHMHHAAIVQWLGEAPLSEGVRAHALALFAVLAEAEASVHGVEPAQVEFHEVGAWDSIVDIVAAAFLIDALGPVAWTHGPLPLGGGTVPTAHGVLPVPAPATLYLLHGVPVVDDGIDGERVTPTGAAIVRHLRAIGRPCVDVGQEMTIGASGMGFGNRRLQGRANMLRCIAFHTLDMAAPVLDDHVHCIEFDVDDQTAEDLAVGLERLRARADVLQIVQLPVFGKKGRLTSRIELLVRDGQADAVVEACFLETATIGLRIQRIRRRTLPRSAGAQAGDVRVKVSARGDADGEGRDGRSRAACGRPCRTRAGAPRGRTPCTGAGARCGRRTRGAGPWSLKTTWPACARCSTASTHWPSR